MSIHVKYSGALIRCGIVVRRIARTGDVTVLWGDRSMVFYRSFYDDEPGGGPMDGFPGGPDSTTPATPAPYPGEPPFVPGGPPAPPKPGQTSTTPDGRGGGRGGGGGFPGSSPGFRFGPVPQFTYPEFDAPSEQDATNSPGYQFRLNSGSDALERSAAARGTLRTGGTLQDILEYGQNFASQEYGQVYNRALQGYDRSYQGARDAFAPRLAEWQMLSGAEQARGLAQFQREWDQYLFQNRQRPQGPMEPPPVREGGSIFG